MQFIIGLFRVFVSTTPNRRRVIAIAAILGLFLPPSIAHAETSLAIADDANIYQDDKDETQKPADTNPCQTCGTGAIAAVLLASLPVSAIATITLLVLTQTQVVSAEPTALGPPIWAIAVGVSAAHTIVAVAAGIAFFRDTVRLCNSAAENSEEPESYRVTYEPVATPPGHDIGMAY